jgi:hypothetical protein
VIAVKWFANLVQTSQSPGGFEVNLSRLTRNYVFVLLGVIGLVLKRQYSGPYAETVLSYWGNLTATFAVYFIVRSISTFGGLSRIASASIALLIVELFEATNGFGVMTNVYDPFDFAANAMAIALAVAVDISVSLISGRRDRHIATDQDAGA